MTRLTSGLLSAVLLFGVAGCMCKHHRRPAPVAPPPAPLVPPAPLPCPPGGVPGVTGPATVPSLPPPPPPPSNVPPPPTPPGLSAVPPPPPTQARWRAAEPTEPVQQVEARNEPPRVQLAAPEPLLGEAPGTTKLYPPDVQDVRPNPPPPIAERKAKSSLPVGIPQFAKATEQVYSGLRPAIDDGLDWLAANGFRTVLHLRAPGEPNDADRAQVEKLGMRYVSLEVSPRTLTPEKVAEFAGIVRDVAGKPLFVYDQDGSLAGPLWYLYFRAVKNHGDEVARIRANGLGLREDRDGPYRDMWLAVQKYLESAR